MTELSPSAPSAPPSPATPSPLEALRTRAYDEAGPLPAVALRPADCIGHVLREPVHAEVDLPPHDVVVTDGWAVAGPGPWYLVGESDGATVLDGTAVPVEAGSALPPGAGAVVPRRTARLDDGRLHAEVMLGDHVRTRAGEVGSGELLIPAGTVMTAGAAALAAAGGNRDVLVTGRPSVSLLVTYGSGTDVAVHAATEALLPTLLRSSGAGEVTTRRIPDTSVSLRSTIDAVRADVVVITGSSASERARNLDHVLTDARVEVVIDGARDAAALADADSWLLVRMRDGRLLVALPADVRSAVAAVLTLVRPLVHGLCGYGAEPLLTRTLDRHVDGRPEQHRFVFVRDGRPTPDHGPDTGHGVAAADALVVVPPGGADALTAVPALPMH